MSILEGKNCLITGATGALGWALAKQLDAEGCNLFLTGTNGVRLDYLASELTKVNDRIVHSKRCLFTYRQSIEQLCAKVDNCLDIDILINAAGVFTISEIDETEELDLDENTEINVIAPYLLCQHFCKGMKKREWGKIINVGSSSSYVGFKGGSLYCMTKHAILGMSRALSEELKDYNIQVSCVSPSSMQSEMAKISIDQDFSTFLKPDDVAKQIVNVLLMENNMTCKELRLDRMIMR